MNNIEIFNISQDNPEPLFDPFYQKGELVIPKTVDEKNTLTEKNALLIELISAFDVLLKMGKNDSSPEIQNIVSQVTDIMSNTEKINYTAFSQFFMVYNSSYSVFQKISDKSKFIYEMLKKYCQERHRIYISHGYSNSILQVMSDNYSHKRNSKTSITKVQNILHSLGVHQCERHMSNEDNFYILPDKGDKWLFENFIQNNHIEMTSRYYDQGKLPDFLFKLKKDYFIMEMKTMKEGGGGQNKQIVEIANFIRYAEKDSHIHYVTFLDGMYANLIFIDESPKIKTQRNDIISCLLNNVQNYFVNTAGFKALCRDYCEKQ